MGPTWRALVCPGWGALLLLLLIPTRIWCYVDDSHLPFKFITQPMDIETQIGSRVILPCKIQNPSSGVQWTRDQFGLGPGRELSSWTRYQIIGNDPKRMI
ncbi:hypothetical protein TCAL_16501 [Tigriopus californicus]|uniref:Ig-like domain-containing protein n=1 Tax=Tigriopus californicus TaxID=6832 RepID=A0A553NUD9_TIGCA|nr:hypothetical protein TCAL_16501 [Tigriopus californicus]